MALVHILVDPNRNIESSLRKFKRLCENYGVVREYKNRKEYKKPSLINKEKSLASLKRRKQNQRYKLKNNL